ncbi:MAG: sigma-70 family RNA polymerase sigma factor [Longimicrobiales bacterium]|nr:sigma-70 family RNA polymerase sigma factor [Longimicrobiales bacterium]
MSSGRDEDLVADVLSDAAMGRFDDRPVPRVRLMPFLKGVVYYSSRNLHRQRTAQGVLMSDLAAPGPPDAWSLAEQLERRRAVRQYVFCLPVDQRRAVIRCLLRGWTTTEAAEADNVGPATIRKRLERARRTLRAQLRTCMGQEGDAGGA